MLQAVRRLIEAIGGHAAAFDKSDYRLAAAALLVHAATIDGHISESEQDELHALIKQRFELDDATVDELLAEAKEADQEAIDLNQFTVRLNRALDEKDRARLVEMLWQIAFADGTVTEFEDNLIWRVADLLGISHRARDRLRAQVAGKK